MEFLIFFPLVSLIFFWLPNQYKKLQPKLYFLLLASCYFYMFFIPIYILVLFAAIIIDYWAGLKIYQATDPVLKKRYLWISIASTCSLLFFFKYINFGITSWNDIQSLLGWNYSLQALKIVLPVGLSFHTFQSLSYVIEIYYGRFVPEKNFFRYSLYVMYYPQLVAGPIERPQNLLPQLQEFKKFDWENIRQGLQLMLWGFFKKIVVADRISYIIGPVFLKPDQFSTGCLWLTAIFFSFQVYCDFSGYSDIAMGVSRCMGIQLSQNFKTPQFALSFNEFWQRWHLTLNQWLHSYVFLPLGGLKSSIFIKKKNSTNSKKIIFVNVFLTFMVSGLWHGAYWTYLLWGAMNGALVVLEHKIKTIRWIQRITYPFQWIFKNFPKTKMLFIFIIISLTEVMFRSLSVADAISIYKKTVGINPYGHFFTVTYFEVLLACFLCVFFNLVDWQLQKNTFNVWISQQKFNIRWAFYITLVFLITFFGVFGKEKYVYFQF